MSGGRVKRAHLRTAPKISVPVRSSTERKRSRPAKESLGTRFSAFQHIPKHVQKMVEDYKAKRRNARALRYSKTSYDW